MMDDDTKEILTQLSDDVLMALTVISVPLGLATLIIVLFAWSAS